MADIAKQCHEKISDDQRQTLADGLGLSVDVLQSLRVGWHEQLSAYTFPMRDACGKIIGIRTRYADGRKRAVKGGENGLFIPADLSDGGTLYVGEGPTDCAALVDAGLPAIGRPSNTAGEDLIVGYVGRVPRDRVVILADRDADPRTAGNTRKAAERLAGRLVPIVGDVRIIQTPASHKDARAWRNAGATIDDIEALADAATSLGPAGELQALLQAEIDGQCRAIAWPWAMVTRGTQALIPGAITLVVGDPGSAKSLWLMESLAYWHDAGERVACYMLERARADHLRRALAQRVGASWLTDLTQTYDRPTEAMAYQSEHAGWLDRFGCTIHTPGDGGLKLTDLIKWTETRATQGARIIVIDPITIAEITERPWDDAQRFLREAGPIIDRAGASLVLVTHPAKLRGRSAGGLRTLDDMAGGSAWARFADCVLWLERHDERREVTVRDSAFPLPQEIEAERTLRIMKVRNGSGSGWQLAVTMNPDTLRFREHGAVVKSERKAPK